MSSFWPDFGFRDSPYNAYPLAATPADHSLYVGRMAEGNRFLTLMARSDARGFVVVSGNAGIGKTSFVNAQQHALASGKLEGFPRLLPAQLPTGIQTSEDACELARRIVETM